MIPLLKTNNGNVIYGKLTKYAEASKEYKINISWNKVVIIVKNKNSDIKNFREILLGKYRGIKFQKEGTYPGQRISLQNTNIAINERLKKTKGEWNLIKNRLFLDNEILPKIKMDLWNVAIKSITKYSTATIETSEASDKKCEVSNQNACAKSISGR